MRQLVGQQIIGIYQTPSQTIFKITDGLVSYNTQVKFSDPAAIRGKQINGHVEVPPFGDNQNGGIRLLAEDGEFCDITYITVLEGCEQIGELPEGAEAVA